MAGNGAPKLLIVDDDFDILANLRDILVEQGYNVTTASSGPDALEKIKSKCPDSNCCFDLCLLDFKMPGMDGAELLERIKRFDPSARAIMITAFAGDDGIPRAQAAGTLTIIRKPMEVPHLLNEIKSALQ